MVYNVAICDDDRRYVEYIKRVLTMEYPGKFCIYCYYSGTELLKDLDINHQLIILDILLRDSQGLVLARKLREKNSRATLMFCSGVVGLTPDMMLVTPYRFLSKKGNAVENIGYLRDAVENMIRDYDVSLEITCERDRCWVALADVVFIDKLNHRRIVHLRPGTLVDMDNKVFATPLSFEQLLLRYEKFGLLRPHSSYLVNIAYIRAKNRNTIDLQYGESFGISRSMAKDFNKKLECYLNSRHT